MGNRLLYVLIGCLTGIVVAGGVAYATIPSSAGVISGCYEKRTGLLRVIDAESGRSCTQWENPISWNQQGPQGAAGPAGTFAGSFSSPNGLFSIEVKDTGIELKGPSAGVKIGAASAELSGPGSLVRTSGTTTVQGSVVTLNGCSKPVARVGDSISGASSPGAATLATGWFPADEPKVKVLEWEGIYLPNGGHPIPVITSFDDFFVPTTAAEVQVSVPHPMVSVNGSIASGAATVCAG